MKKIFFTLCFITPLLANAQQFPGALSDNKAEITGQVPDHWNDNNDKSVPDNVNGNAFIIELLKAQTEAINSLSADIETLEKRVSNLEAGGNDGN